MASWGTTSANDNSRATPAHTRVSNPRKRRVFLLGLRQRGRPGQFARRVSNPSSPRYRRFLSLRQYRKRFSPNRAERRRVRRYLASRRGIKKVELSSDRSVVLAVLTPGAGRRLFCAAGAGAPSRALCTPPALRGTVRQVSAGEVYELGANSGPAGAHEPENTKAATPQGCEGAIKTGAFTPYQLSTAYGVDELHSRGLEGSGVRVATLSSQELDTAGLRTWGRCLGLATPAVRQFAMPGASRDTATAPEETVLDVEALASLAPGLQRITPIFVPLDQSFSNSGPSPGDQPAPT